MSSSNYGAEIAVSSNNYVYVIWAVVNNIMLSYSTDGAQTFSAPVTVGAGVPTAHMATDGAHVYVITRRGSRFL